MKAKVSLYIAGRILEEFIYARDYPSARQAALAKNPTTKVVRLTAVFN